MEESQRVYTYNQWDASNLFARIWWETTSQKWSFQCGNRKMLPGAGFHEADYEYFVVLSADAQKGNWEVLVLFGEAWLHRDLSKFTDNLRNGAHHTKVYVTSGYMHSYEDMLDRILPEDTKVFQIIRGFLHQTEPGSSAKPEDLEPLRRRAKSYLASIE